MSEENKNHLILISIVAIVAIVGLSFLFIGRGNANYSGKAAEAMVANGDLVGESTVPLRASKFLDPTKCVPTTFTTQTDPSARIWAQCASNQVIGFSVANCVSDNQIPRVFGYGNGANTLPWQIAYTCMSPSDGKWNVPQSVVAFCCTI